jgi:tetratricopeptide (TPR) repeat protein
MKNLAIWLIVTGLLNAAAQPQSNNARLQSRDELNQGVQAYKDGHYAEAVQHFKKALILDPANQNVELFLATAYFIQWVPGADLPDNTQNYALAKEHFEAVLERDAKNELALAMLAAMAYNSAQAGTPEQKAAALDEAKRWNERRIEVNPTNAEPYYYLGVISWSKAYAPVSKARVEAHMKSTDHRPLEDSVMRGQLQTKYWEIVQEGLDNLKTCLEIDPRNEDAMSYTTLLFRVKATLEDDAGNSEGDFAEAEIWMNKALETKKEKAAKATANHPQ